MNILRTPVEIFERLVTLILLRVSNVIYNTDIIIVVIVILIVVIIVVRMTQNDSFSALARFDLNKTWWELIVGVTVPGILFAVSFFTLLIVHQTVKVGDDARMTCQWCADDNEADGEPFVKPAGDQIKAERKHRKRAATELQELSVIEALVARSADMAVGRPPLMDGPDV